MAFDWRQFLRGKWWRSNPGPQASPRELDRRIAAAMGQSGATETAATGSSVSATPDAPLPSPATAAPTGEETTVPTDAMIFGGQGGLPKHGAATAGGGDDRTKWLEELETGYEASKRRPVSEGRGQAGRRPTGHLGRRDRDDHWGSRGSGRGV